MKTIKKLTGARFRQAANFSLIALGALLISSSASPQCNPPKGCKVGNSHTAHSFLKPRSQANALSLTRTNLNEFIRMMDDEEKKDPVLQVVAFFAETTSASSAGKYFGVKAKNSFTLRDLATEFRPSQPTGATIIPSDADNVTISLSPKQISYGATFTLYKNLSDFCGGTFFEADFPVVHVEHSMRSCISGGGDGAAQFFGDLYAGRSVANLGLPSGSVAPGSFSDNDRRQDALMRGKQSIDGLADIDVRCGYKFLEYKWLQASAALGLTIPTTSKPKGHDLFEPTIGNCQHWALGGDLAGTLNVLNMEEHNLSFGLHLRYRWVFRGDEQRPVPLTTTDTQPNGTYLPLTANTNTADDLKNFCILRPATMTFKLHVEPGSQFDGILYGTYNWRGFTADLGYNLYYRDGENVSEKQEGFFDNHAREFNGFNPVSNDDRLTQEARLEAQRIPNYSLAATPSQASHKIYGGVGYIFNDKHEKKDYLVGIGGHYEVKHKNSIFSSWGINGRFVVEW